MNILSSQGNLHSKIESQFIIRIDNMCCLNIEITIFNSWFSLTLLNYAYFVNACNVHGTFFYFFFINSFLNSTEQNGQTIGNTLLSIRSTKWDSYRNQLMGNWSYLTFNGKSIQFVRIVMPSNGSYRLYIYIYNINWK